LLEIAHRAFAALPRTSSFAANSTVYGQVLGRVTPKVALIVWLQTQLAFVQTPQASAKIPNHVDRLDVSHTS
jgi:hypothetical protein